MSKRHLLERPSLAKKYALRRNVIVKLPDQMPKTTYYSTSSLKGGKHTYKGKVVTRSARDGRIIRVEKVDKEKA